MIKLSVNQTTNNRSIYFSIKQVKYLLIYLSHTPEPILVLLLFEEPMTGKSLKHRESVPQWLHFVIYWHQWNVPASPHQKYPPHLTFSNQPTSQLHCTMVSLQLRDNLIVFFAWTKLGSDFTSNKEITETDRQIGIYALTIYGRFMPLTFKRLILPTYRYSEWRLVLQ